MLQNGTLSPPLGTADNFVCADHDVPVIPSGKTEKRTLSESICSTHSAVDSAILQFFYDLLMDNIVKRRRLFRDGMMLRHHTGIGQFQVMENRPSARQPSNHRQPGKPLGNILPLCRLKMADGNGRSVPLIEPQRRPPQDSAIEKRGVDVHVRLSRKRRINQ